MSLWSSGVQGRAEGRAQGQAEGPRGFVVRVREKGWGKTKGRCLQCFVCGCPGQKDCFLFLDGCNPASGRIKPRAAESIHRAAETRKQRVSTDSSSPSWTPRLALNVRNVAFRMKQVQQKQAEAGPGAAELRSSDLSFPTARARGPLAGAAREAAEGGSGPKNFEERRAAQHLPCWPGDSAAPKHAGALQEPGAGALAGLLSFATMCLLRTSPRCQFQSGTCWRSASAASHASSTSALKSSISSFTLLGECSEDSSVCVICSSCCCKP